MLLLVTNDDEGGKGSNGQSPSVYIGLRSDLRYRPITQRLFYGRHRMTVLRLLRLMVL